jgi:hypothetical protein
MAVSEAFCYQLHVAALGVLHNVAMAIAVAIGWVRQVTLLETEGQILGDRYAPSKKLDEPCSLRPEARRLSQEDFDPELVARASRRSIVSPFILLTAAGLRSAGDKEPSCTQSIPQETKTVVFHIPQDQRAVWNAQRQWVVEPGRYTLWVGGSSLASLTTSFQLNP